MNKQKKEHPENKDQVMHALLTNSPFCSVIKDSLAIHVLLPRNWKELAGEHMNKILGHVYGKIINKLRDKRLVLQVLMISNK